MAEAEGVIKFNLSYQKSVMDDFDISELSAWRSTLKQLGLLGQETERYDGYGFGNVSIRCGDGFVISGTQTGHLNNVTLADYALCESWDLANNAITASGIVKPSSESLSHAAVYDVHPEVMCTLHVHSPDICSLAEALSLATTQSSVAYGTPEMASEVRRLIVDMPLPGIFSMGGHEDGVFTFGRTIVEAGNLLISTLSKARQ